MRWSGRRQELTGPVASLLEQLSVERIVRCWLYLAVLEPGTEASLHQAAEASMPSVALADLELKTLDVHQRWLDRAHWRYLAAIKALAQVRRLQVLAM